VTSISLNATSLTLDANVGNGVGEQYQLKATVSPSNAVIKTVTYSSSNPSVASVTASGKVTAMKAGTATITVKADDGSGVKKTCSVRVNESYYNGKKVTVDGIKYKVTSNTKKGGKVSVYGVSNKSATTYTIPTTVKMGGYTYKVVEIDSSAFANCSKLTTVKVATSITSIGNKAFYNCKKLTTVGSKSKVITLTQVKTIGTSAFEGCSSIKTVNISSTALTKIGDAAFKGCTSMTGFTAKSTALTTIGKNAFYGDSKLATVSLKTTKLKTSTVGANAFKGIKSTCTFSVPSKNVSSYKKIFIAKGAGSKIKVKKG
jgi:hypothetical protein